MVCRAGALTLDSASQINQARENHCHSFLILTGQRSGSSWLWKELNDLEQFHVGHEGFNLAEGTHEYEKYPMATGGELAHQLGLNRHMVKKMGAKHFAQEMFDHLAQGAAPPCLVGFFMMGSNVDTFNNDETRGLLAKGSITKVVLKRENTTEQWISHETACWFGDWNGQGASKSEHIGHLKEAQERLQRGETCDGHTLEKFKRQKDNQYNEWMTMVGDQKVIELTTEHLDHQIHDLVSGLRTSVAELGREPNVPFITFDILTDDA